MGGGWAKQPQTICNLSCQHAFDDGWRTVITSASSVLSDNEDLTLALSDCRGGREGGK